MVTRIYTPLIAPYAPPRRREESEAGPAPEAPRYFGPQPGAGGPGDADNTAGQRSRGLATVQDQTSTQKIRLPSILQDFCSTMDALGAPPEVRQEVDAYLGVVEMHAGKPNPSAPFIRQSLKTAADSLDGFITNALGQPSKVVRDWVDALLLQNVDFQVSPKTATAETGPEKPDGDNPGNEKAVKTLVEQGRRLSAEGNGPGAEQAFREALDTLGREEGSRPDWAGKIHGLLGKHYRSTGRNAEAMAEFRQAAERFTAAGQPERAGHALHAAGRLAESLGDWPNADQLYGQAVGAMRSAESPVPTDWLNDAGSVWLRQGKAQQALQAFEEARKGLGEDTTPLADLWSNSAAAYRALGQPREAEQAYRNALDAAFARRDKDTYKAALDQLAHLYEDEGAQAKAAAMRQKARTL